jgi:hypothetical protein
MLESLLKVFARIYEIQEKFGQLSGSKRLYDIPPSTLLESNKKAPDKSDVNNTPSFKETFNEVKGLEKQNFQVPYQYQKLITKICSQYNVDPKLIVSIIRAESNFNPNAISSAGACGLMQLMPQTARMMGVKNIFAPAENIEAGVKYFKQLLEEFNGNLPLALAAYNAGPETVRKAGGIPQIIETQNYVAKVLKYFYESS